MAETAQKKIRLRLGQLSADEVRAVAACTLDSAHGSRVRWPRPRPRRGRLTDFFDAAAAPARPLSLVSQPLAAAAAPGRGYRPQF